MKIKFYNYELMGTTMSYQHPLIMKFIDELNTDDFEQINNQLKEKFNLDGPQYGTTTIDTKTIALLNITKEEIIHTIQDNKNTIYNKDFKNIISRINTHNKNNSNTDLYMLKIFFELSIRAKSKYISLYLQSKEL